MIVEDPRGVAAMLGREVREPSKEPYSAEVARWATQVVHSSIGQSEEQVTLNQRADGYRGIWYMNQPSNDEYVYKYSGGLGTYCAKHQPFAIYCKQVNKTCFCYGDATVDDSRKLLHMVS